MFTASQDDYSQVLAIYMKQSKANIIVSRSIPLFVQNNLNVIFNLPLYFLEWSREVMVSDP